MGPVGVAAPVVAPVVASGPGTFVSGGGRTSRDRLPLGVNGTEGGHSSTLASGRIDSTGTYPSTAMVLRSWSR